MRLSYYFFCDRCTNKRTVQNDSEKNPGYQPPTELPCGVRGCEGRMYRIPNGMMSN